MVRSPILRGGDLLAYFLAAVVFVVLGAVAGSPVTCTMAAGHSTARFNLSSQTVRTMLSVKSVSANQCGLRGVL